MTSDETLPGRCSRCGASPAPRQARSVCNDCEVGTELCEACFIGHARDVLADFRENGTSEKAAGFHHSGLQREKIRFAADVVAKADAASRPPTASEQALAEIREFLDAHQAFANDREVRCVTAFSSDFPQLTLGGIRALYEAARGVAVMEQVTALLTEHAPLPGRKTLYCSQDVADGLFLHGAPGGADQLCVLMGIDVAVIPSYGPGKWKLVRHDHCDVTGGYGTGDAMIVNHDSCTVLGESAGKVAGS